MIATLMFLTLTLPAEETGDPEESANTPSLELLEYIGGMEEDADGNLLDPMDLPSMQEPPSLDPENPAFASSARKKLSNP